MLVAIVFAETGLLVGFFLPGDSLLVTAGLLANHMIGLNIWVLNGVLMAAAILGDTTGYAIGYHLGVRLFARADSRFFRRDHLRRTQAFYDKHGAKTIVLARFMPIVRTFAPTVAGAARMPYRTFVTFNMIGGVLWVASMTLIGYFLGRAIPDIEHHLHWVIAVVIVVSFIPLWHEWRASRKSRQQRATEVSP